MRNLGVGDDNARVDRESFAAHKVGHARFEPMGVWSRYELGVAFGLGRGFCAIRRVRFWRLPFAFCERRICIIARGSILTMSTSGLSSPIIAASRSFNGLLGLLATSRRGVKFAL